MKRVNIAIPIPHLFTAAVFFLLLGIILAQEGQVNHRASTWSIVAVDPRTGDAGAAGASCVPVNAAALAALVPGKGAAATQAEFVIENRDRVLTLLQEGIGADEILRQVASRDSDPNLALRQYGIVTMDDGAIQAAGFTGQGNFTWAGDIQDVGLAVSVQGNILESEDVAGQALEVFRAEDMGTLPLADRLMRALEAGSAAGGDKRCNQDGIQQTALSAFIAVVTSGQEPFAVPLSTSTELERDEHPWLYLSVIEEEGGANPIRELRRQYRQWRPSNLPPCPLCDQFPIIVPPGGVNGTAPADGISLDPAITIEPTVDLPEVSPVATQQEIEPAGAIDEEGDGSSPGVLILLLLATGGVAATAAGYVLVRRSRSVR